MNFTKIILITLIILLYSKLANSQSLSLDNLINLQGLDVENINDNLLKSGWEYNGNFKSNDSSVCASWSYEKKLSGNAQAWLYFCPNNHYLQYQFFDKKVYTQIKERIVQYKMKVKSTDLDDSNGITTVYEGKNYIISLRVLNKDVMFEAKASYFVSVERKF